MCDVCRLRRCVRSALPLMRVLEARHVRCASMLPVRGERDGLHMRYVPDGLHVKSVLGKLPIRCVRDAVRRRFANPYLHSPHTESDRSELLVRIWDMHAKHGEPINQMRLLVLKRAPQRSTPLMM